MKNNSFSIKEALSIGWHKSLAHVWFLIGLWVLPIIVAIAFVLLTVIAKYIFSAERVFQFFNMITPLGFMLTILAVIPLFISGILRIYDDIYTNDQSGYKQLYRSSKYYFKELLICLLFASLFIGCFFISINITFGSVFYGANISGVDQIVSSFLLAMLLWVIVFFIVLPLFLFSSISIVTDDSQTVFQALRLSKKISKGYRVKLFCFSLISCFLASIGCGFFMSVIGIAWVHVYKKLKDMQSV